MFLEDIQIGKQDIENYTIIIRLNGTFSTIPNYFARKPIVLYVTLLYFLKAMTGEKISSLLMRQT